jgi:hypothetical protein
MLLVLAGEAPLLFITVAIASDACSRMKFLVATDVLSYWELKF